MATQLGAMFLMLLAAIALTESAFTGGTYGVNPLTVY